MSAICPSLTPPALARRARGRSASSRANIAKIIPMERRKRWATLPKGRAERGAEASAGEVRCRSSPYAQRKTSTGIIHFRRDRILPGSRSRQKKAVAVRASPMPGTQICQPATRRVVPNPRQRNQSPFSTISVRRPAPSFKATLLCVLATQPEGAAGHGPLKSPRQPEPHHTARGREAHQEEGCQEEQDNRRDGPGWRLT